eukprot:scaffold670239_cov66-Prasinocladus_malaysianus.AAC.1
MKRRFVQPLAFIGPPEPSDVDRVLAEPIEELRSLALNRGVHSLDVGEDGQHVKTEHRVITT